MTRRRDRSVTFDSGLVYQPPSGVRVHQEPLFATGEVIDSTYQIGDLIRTTDSGQVYEAWDMVLERTVALKGARQDSETPSPIVEARLLASIDDPCAAAVYGVGNHRGNEFLVTERIIGVSLADYIAAAHSKGRRLSVRTAVVLLAQLARSLAALHQVALWVPTTSTQTLILTPNRRLVMAALALGQGTSAVEAMPLAPETIANANLIDDPERASAAVDLYALGCVAVELCTGAPPFADIDLDDAKSAHLHARPPRLVDRREDLPPELGDLVEELLAKRPAARPPSARYVAQQFDVIADRLTATRDPLRILLVHGEPARLRQLWSLLHRAHATVQVIIASNAEEALSKMQTAMPDALIADMGLAGNMNALELFMYMQGINEAERCVLIALGNAIKAEDVQVLDQLGIDNVLSYADIADTALMDLLGRLVEELPERAVTQTD